MPVAVLILAAGSGTRMKSAQPKVLHQIGGAPMILHVIKTVEDARPDLVHIITGKGEEQIRSELKQAGFSCRTIRQVRQKGTAHAVAAAKQVLGGFSGQIVVLYGDTPFIRTETIQKMQQAIRGSGRCRHSRFPRVRTKELWSSCHRQR